MPNAAFFDWQTGVTLGIGLAALAYLLRRWWPAWRRLWQRPVSAEGTSCERATTAACGGGCGSCGSAGMPQRDHRITVQRSKPG